MERIKFNPDEIKNAEIIEGRRGKQIRFDTPISPRENALLVYRKEKPLWMPGLSMEANPINLDFYRDSLCRTPAEGKDIFGIEWQYVEKVGGGIVRPGAPTVTDINHWEDFVTLPDVDSWDWEGCRERNKDNFDPSLLNRVTILTGFFERLISFMDFENAAVALVDEEQQEGVHRLFDFLVGVYEKFIDNSKKYFDVDVITFHDDWGAQRAPFFSLDTCREMLLPYMKRVVDHMHAKGIYFDFHSCGKNETLVPAMIEAGMDTWGGQELNDKFMLREKYGDAMIWTMFPTVQVSDNADDSEIFAAAKDFIDRCGPDGNCIASIRTVTSAFKGYPMKMIEYAYQLSREMYNQ